MQQTKTIVFVGDSITEGAGDDEKGGWTRRLAPRLPAHVRAVHAGVGGDSILLILQRMQRDVLDHDPQLIVLAVGINDSHTNNAGLNWVERAEYERGLDRFADLAGERPIILVGLTPIDDARTSPIAEDTFYTDRASVEYDAILRGFAQRRGFTYIPIAEHFQRGGGAAQLTTDGLHPTPRGHQLIADAVWSALEAQL
jgi:lysophospholipase L1-like esterase